MRPDEAVPDERDPIRVKTACAQDAAVSVPEISTLDARLRSSDDTPRYQALPHLLVRARGGDRDALGAMLTLVYPILVRFARGRFASTAEANELAKDAAQETALRVVLHVENCRADGAGQIIAWVLMIAWRVTIDTFRDISTVRRARSAYMREVAGVAGDSSTAGASEDSDADSRSTPAQRLTMLALVEHERAGDDIALLFWGRLVGHYSWAELAGALSTTPTAAKRRYQRAQAALYRAVLRAVGCLEPAERARLLTFVHTASAAEARSDESRNAGATTRQQSHAAVPGREP